MTNFRCLARSLMIFSLLLPLILSAPRPADAKTAREIDVSVEVALERFFREVEGAREFAANAEALLVMPGVIKAGLVVGGQYGEGALLIDGRTVAYYNLIAGSYGLQIGAESKDIVIAFMTERALESFRASKGWEAGVDGSVALIDQGVGKRLDTTTLRDPIVGFVFGVQGLMADLSLKGAKFTQVEKGER